MVASRLEKPVAVPAASSDVIWRQRTQQMLVVGRKILQMRERLQARRRAELSYEQRQAPPSPSPAEDRPRPTSTS